MIWISREWANRQCGICVSFLQCADSPIPAVKDGILTFSFPNSWKRSGFSLFHSLQIFFSFSSLLAHSRKLKQRDPPKKTKRPSQPFPSRKETLKTKPPFHTLTQVKQQQQQT